MMTTVALTGPMCMVSAVIDHRHSMCGVDIDRAAELLRRSAADRGRR
jgi:hypothetical protein